jgi:hypothetical protein
VVGVPGFTTQVGSDFDVACAKRFGRVKQLAPDRIRGRSARAAGPPVAEELELDVDQAVVLEDRAHLAVAVLLARGDQICVEQSEAAEASVRGGPGAFDQAVWAELGASQWRCVAGGRPAAGDQIVCLHVTPSRGCCRRRSRGRST